MEIRCKEADVAIDPAGGACCNPARRMPAPPQSKVDHMFRAFAEPVRLRILHLLRDGEMCVCDLVEVLKLPQPTVSRHLSYLRRAGLVAARADASWNYYSLADAESTFHQRLLECLAVCFTEVPELGADTRRARALKTRSGRCNT
jgi:ArsR family transcriptional regulator, arsenate/arsenite/antimonite-responsive transcriptional repressor